MFEGSSLFSELSLCLTAATVNKDFFARDEELRLFFLLLIDAFRLPSERGLCEAVCWPRTKKHALEATTTTSSEKVKRKQERKRRNFSATFNVDDQKSFFSLIYS